MTIGNGQILAQISTLKSIAEAAAAANGEIGRGTAQMSGAVLATADLAELNERLILEVLQGVDAFTIESCGDGDAAADGNAAADGERADSESAEEAEEVESV